MLVGVPIPIALTNPSTWTLVERLLNEPVKPVIIPLALMSPDAVMCPAGPLMVTVPSPNLVVPPIICGAVPLLALILPGMWTFVASFVELPSVIILLSPPPSSKISNTVPEGPTNAQRPTVVCFI